MSQADELLPELIATKTEWSIRVGGGVTLSLKNGRPKYLIMVCGTTDGINKEQDAAICERIIAAWSSAPQKMGE